MTDGSPTLRRRRLGKRLRTARQALGLTGTRVAEILEISQSKVSRIESGSLPVRAKELREFLDLYQIPDADRAELIELGHDTGERGWWLRYAAIVSRGYATYIGCEDGADEIRTWEPALIPGHLQTEAYYRALAAGSRVVVADQVDALSEVRAERQRRLTKRRVRLDVVLDESVLHRVVGDRDVMADEYRWLLERADDPQTEIRVMPYDRGQYSVGFGGITVMSYADGLKIVWGETPTNETSIEEERPEVCEEIYEHLRSTALPPAESREMLRGAWERSK